MRKFAQLEEVIAATKPKVTEVAMSKKSSKCEMSDEEAEEEEQKKREAMDNPLSFEQLQTVFQQTSLYSMNSLKRNNEIFFDRPVISEDGFVIGLESANIDGLMFDVDYEVHSDDMLDFFPQNDSDYMSEGECFADDDDDEKAVRRKRPRSQGTLSIRRRRVNRDPAIASRMVGGTFAEEEDSEEEKPRQAYEIDFQKFPPYPLPRSWGLPIQRFKTKIEHSELPNFEYQEADILTMKHSQYLNGKTYTGILMDPPFDLSNGIVEKTPGTVTLEDFRKMPLPQLMPAGGMLFIWTPTELTMQVTRICLEWGFLFAEHGALILKERTGGVWNRSTNALAQCKCNLLLFRRFKSRKTGAYYPLKINHQRTSDSFFDFAQFHPETGQLCRSHYQYRVSEIMIKCFDPTKHINMLYLWAPKDEQRQGWHVICDTRQQALLKKLRKPLNEDNYW
jgi:hypothetical protein